jgi:hypothetical protein
MGGSLIDSLTSLVVEGRSVVYAGSDSIEGQVTTYYLFPYSYRHDVRLPAGELATLVTSEGAFLLVRRVASSCPKRSGTTSRSRSRAIPWLS